MSNDAVQKRIEELKKSIIIQGMGQFTVSNLEKVRKLEELIKKVKLNHEL